MYKSSFDMKLIRLNESDLENLITESIAQYLLTESQESKSIDAAKKLAMQHGLSYEEADKLVRYDIRHNIPFFSHNPKGGKFILGVTRMYLDGQIQDAQAQNSLNTALKYVVSDAHYNEYDRNLNGMSAQDLIQRFAKNVEMDMERDRNEVDSMQFEGNSLYNIVRIDSFEQACEYNKYTYKGSQWCLTYSKGNYDSYTCNGINQIYFCLRKGFEGTQPQVGENCPLDEYGLSMISVIVNESGSLAFCTSRWNHANDGNDNIMDTKQISQVIGMNFYEVFKPNNRWKEVVDNALQRLSNGENPRDVFDYCYDSIEGFAVAELNGKWNFIDTEGNLLSPNQWFDECGDFDNGFAKVYLNEKWNFIDTEGNLLSKNQWFDDCGSFYEGFASVKLNGKWNFIDAEGNFVWKKPLEEWFDDCEDFYNGFAVVKLNGKWNWIDTECNFVWKKDKDQWFDYCYNFNDGFAKVQLNGKCNWIDTEGNLLLPNQWFDACSSFKNGFAALKLNGKCNWIDTEGNLYDEETKEPLGINVKTMNKQNESIMNVFTNMIMEKVMHRIKRTKK